jgi:hypothetical protein
MEEEDFPIDKYTVQLYYHPSHQSIEDNIPEQIASGVLVRRHEKYFLLTCKHVFEYIDPTNVVIFISWGFVVRLPSCPPVQRRLGLQPIEHRGRPIRQE